MNKIEILAELKKLSNEQTKIILSRHGAKEPFYGVKIADLKKLKKYVKNNHELALELWNTGISDAMYLAGLSINPQKMDKGNLQHWVKTAYWYMLSEYSVADAAAGSRFAQELALEWIDSKEESISSSGWATMAKLISINPLAVEEELVIALLAKLKIEIKNERNRVKYTMNNFLIAAGSKYPDLYDECIAIAKHIGKIDVDMGKTACKVPNAEAYIKKVIHHYK